jgi:transposase
MKKEIAELKRANDILKAAASFFAAELDRPHLRSRPRSDLSEMRTTTP